MLKSLSNLRRSCSLHVLKVGRLFELSRVLVRQNNPWKFEVSSVKLIKLKNLTSVLVSYMPMYECFLVK